MGLFDFFKKKPSIPPEALCLWVHRRRHLEQLEVLRKREGQGPFAMLRPFSDVFAFALALGTTDGAMAVSLDQLEQLDLSPEDAFTQACRNAHPSLQMVARGEGVCAWQGLQAPAALTMMSAIRPHLGLQGAPVMIIPREQLVLVAGADDVAGLSKLIEVAERAYVESDDFVSLRPVTWKDGPIPVEWFPPAGHPLSDRFAAARARTRRHQAQGEYHLFAEEAAPLAHLAALPADKGGQLIASWMRDANVVLPADLDRVILIDTDDEPLPRVEVALSTLLATFPEAFEPLATGEAKKGEDDELLLEDARLVRTRGVLFPTLAEKRYLVARQALLDAKVPAESREVPGAELLAAWDAGDALIARPELDGRLRLQAPDGRVASVTREEFGERWKRRGPADQQRFMQSLTINTLLSAMLDAAIDETSGAADDDDEAESEDAPSDEETGDDESGEDDAAQAPTRPVLLRSNDLAGARQEREDGDEENTGMQELMKQMLGTGEPARLFPIARPPGFDDGARQNELGMVQGFTGDSEVKVVHPERLVRPGPEGIAFELVSDRGNRVMVLNGALFGGELLEPTWRTALLNLKAASIDVPHRKGDGWYEGPWHDDYDASRMLLIPGLARGCRVKGETLIFAPTVGRTWVVGSDDLEGLTAVLDAAEAHLGSEDTVTPYQFRQLLFGWPWVVRGEAVERWTVPATHALAGRIDALDRMLLKRRASSSQHVGAFARATFSPLQPRDGSKA